MNREPQACHQCGRKIYFNGICIPCQAENERNKILLWDQERIEQEISNICAEIEKSGELVGDARNLLRNLVNYRDIDTSKIAEIAFHKNLFWPEIIYKNAPEYVIKSMIETLQKDDIDSSYAGKLLLCLAVYGGVDVFQAFLKLEKNPRDWRKKLYVNPSFYATYGGWTYDENGKYIKTQYDECYPIVKGTSEEKENSPLRIGLKTKERCKYCGCQILNLMELDGRDNRLRFLGIDGVVKVKCCPNCFGSYDGDWNRYTLDGESELIYYKECGSEDNYIEEGIEEIASNTFVMGREPVPLRYAADWEGGSSIGGFAFWIQDCEIKICPECGKPMKYLAQIQWDTIFDGMEGNAYIEICTDCKLITIIHQQT